MSRRRLAVGSTFQVQPFAENREGLRATGTTITVRIVAAGTDEAAPLVYQTVPPRLETPDSIEIFARDPDGFVRIIGFIAKDQAGNIVHRAADTLPVPIQQVSRKMAFNAPIVAPRQDAVPHGLRDRRRRPHRLRVPTGANVAVSADSLGKRDRGRVRVRSYLRVAA